MRVADRNAVGPPRRARDVRDRVPPDRGVLARVNAAVDADEDALRRPVALDVADPVGEDADVVRAAVTRAAVFEIDALRRPVARRVGRGDGVDDVVGDQSAAAARLNDNARGGPCGDGVHYRKTVDGDVRGSDCDGGDVARGRETLHSRFGGAGESPPCDGVAGLRAFQRETRQRRGDRDVLVVVAGADLNGVARGGGVDGGLNGAEVARGALHAVVVNDDCRGGASAEEGGERERGEGRDDGDHDRSSGFHPLHLLWARGRKKRAAVAGP